VITKGRAWDLYTKRHSREAYHCDYDQIKRPKRSEPKPLKIHMSNSTDPYLPQDKRLRLTWSVPDEMRDCSPNVLFV
jgi:DNA repair photolyase